ncbi:MAG: anti-anti-sigma factor [Paraglaciecola sp.]|jgi:anti-anti-sigma factor
MSKKIIQIHERFDFGYYKEFTEQYQKALAENNVDEIVLDFRCVEYLDSSALGMMVLLHKKAKSNNVSVKISGTKERTMEILQIANFDQLFEIS